MSAATLPDTTVTPPATRPTTDPPRNPPGRKLHMWRKGDGDVARELGVQVRALCGVWVWPGGRVVYGAALLPKSPQSRRCKRCVAAYPKHVDGTPGS